MTARLQRQLLQSWWLMGLLVATSCHEGSSGPPLVRATSEDLVAAIREPGARAIVLNVWATWCVPCREEFPELLRLRQAYGRQGLRLLLVSADFPDRAGDARRFLAGQGVDFATYLKTGDDMAFIAGLNERWSGALPATFVYDAQGELRGFTEGRTTYEALERQVREAFQSTDSTREETPR